MASLAALSSDASSETSSGPSSGGPTAAQLADPGIAKIWASAQDFEAMALGALLKPIFATVDTSGDPLSGGQAEEAWRPMMVDEMSKAIAKHGGIGLAAPVFHQMLQIQEARSNPA